MGSFADGRFVVMLVIGSKRSRQSWCSGCGSLPTRIGRFRLPRTVRPIATLPLISIPPAAAGPTGLPCSPIGHGFEKNRDTSRREFRGLTGLKAVERDSVLSIARQSSLSRKNEHDYSEEYLLKRDQKVWVWNKADQGSDRSGSITVTGPIRAMQ